MLVINLFGGPSTGKSTTAAEIFVYLKKKKINCEYITEYAKDKTWEGAKKVLENQIYIFGKQQHMMFRVADKVDIMVCDSPLLLSMIYGELESSSLLYKLILEEFNKYNNLNYYLERETIYDPIGRYQTEENAIKIDDKIVKILTDNEISYSNYNINDGVETIIEKINEML